jgi:NADH-quinone oxidoreductase subunit F
MGAVDEILGAPESIWEGGIRGSADDHVAYGGRAMRERRHLLLPVLHSIQDRTGWVSRGALEYACRRLSIPPAEAYGVVSFYARFGLDEQRHDARHVCDDIPCLVAGAQADGHGSPCLGQCDRAPATLIERFGDAYDAVPESSVPEPPPRSVVSLLRRVGAVDPERIDSYREHGGYAALRRAREIGGEQVIKRLTDSKLLGRGGAAFPTGRKWASVAAAQAPRYLVCNADESETGTFKDRVIMERDPFAVVEGMAIAAFATGCEKGYIYVRTEYPLARARIENAIAQARAAGMLDIDIEVRRGAGAYICGEETALFNSIEGKRGEPRNKPPFPVQAGLFGRPTLVNNVETLVNVLDVVNGEFRDSRIFCVSGSVARPGVYEVALGTPLRRLLEMAGAKDVRTVLLGGAAGSFVMPQQFDVPLSFDGTREIGATLGSGAVIVLDDKVDMKLVLLRIARFFRDESCGQCVPCRVGTKRQEEILERMLEGRNGHDRESDLMLLSDVAQAMRDASICGLGQTAANAIASGLKELPVLNG